MTILFLVAAIVISGCALSVAIDVSKIRRELLSDIRKILMTMPPAPTPFDPIIMSSLHMHRSLVFGSGFFVIWEWTLGEWAPMTELIPSGAHPGMPPPYPGAFSGDKVKIWISTR
jgi:hypothetical protein